MNQQFTKTVALVLVSCALLLSACTKKTAELGSAENPVKLHFVPSVDAKVIEENSKTFKDFIPYIAVGILPSISLLNNDRVFNC